MKKAYKNKRDQYKAEAEIERMLKETAVKNANYYKSLLEKQQEEKKKWWSSNVYCSNCQSVTSIQCPPGKDLDVNADCVVCRVEGHLAIVSNVYVDRTGRI